MLALHWLSQFRRKAAPQISSPDIELEQLKKNLLNAAANASALGSSAAIEADSLRPLFEMLEVVRLEIGKIESSAALLEQTSPKKSRRYSWKRVQGNDSPAIKIARRLLSQGVTVRDAARKTLLPESTVERLARETAPTAILPPAAPPIIERSQMLL